jgi:hypothetical protein
MRKSFSVDCLPSSSSPSSSLCSSRVSIDDNSDKASVDYLSDVLLGPVQARKKGVFWILLISPVFFFLLLLIMKRKILVLIDFYISSVGNLYRKINFFLVTKKISL